MNNAFPGERLNTRIHSQLSLHIEIEPRAVELTVKLLTLVVSIILKPTQYSFKKK